MQFINGSLKKPTIIFKMKQNNARLHKRKQNKKKNTSKILTISLDSLAPLAQVAPANTHQALNFIPLFLLN